MARKQKPREDEREDDFLRQLRAHSNGGGGFGDRQIDGTLLAMVVWAITAKGGQISFGTTQDRTRFVMTCWYKGFPTKGYFQAPEEVERSLAFTLDIWLPRAAEYDEWRKYAGDFK
mgnify:FL=1